LIPVRCFYGPVLLLIISITYSRWFGLHWSDWQQLFEPHSIRRELLSSFANSFFTSFMMLLMAASFLLTPIYTATAVVEERERGNLDLLLATPLTSREIVLGLLASRLATLGLIIVTGLPILSLLPFWVESILDGSSHHSATLTAPSVHHRLDESRPTCRGMPACPHNPDLPVRVFDEAHPEICS
jgi:hypothetical protein